MDKKEANCVLFSNAHEKLEDSHLDCGSPSLRPKFFFFFNQIIKHRRLYDLLKTLSEQEQGNNISGFQLKCV